MRRILFFTLLMLSFGLLNAQSDVCATAEGTAPLSITSGAPAPMTFTPGWGDSGDYTPGNASLVSDGFIRIDIPAGGYYDIDFNPTGGSSGLVSLGFGPDCSSIAEAVSGTIGADFPIVCNLLTGGVQMMAVSFETGSGADFSITFTAATPPINDDCIGAIDELSNTSIAADNTCAVDGLVWYQYTVTDGHNIDVTTTDGTLVGSTINAVFLGSCAGVDITNSWDCLSPGDIIFIEAGNTTPDHGTFTIDITDGPNGVANDDCTGATFSGVVSCVNSAIGAGDLTACFDLEATCPPTDLAAAGGIPENASSGVWYDIDIDASVPTFSFTGTTFEVFTGACGSLVSLGCEGDAALTNVDPDLTGTDYLILVYDNGSFDATSDFTNPVNDLCGGGAALPIGSPGAGGSLTGTLACADGNDITGTACTASEAAQVFYTYTTGADKADINIAISGNTLATGTSAAQTSFVVMLDCTGTISTDPNAQQCDVLDLPTTDLVCVEPNTTLTIIVQSTIADAGDFEITITETSPAAGQPTNDLCGGADPLVGGVGSGTTECANNEHNICGATSTDADYQTVYFSYTVTAVTANLQITVTGSGSPALSVGSIAFYDDCTIDDLGDEYDRINTTGLTCDFTTGIDLVCVPAGTYTIAVGSSLAGQGSFDINVVETDASVVNDLCSNAEAISSVGNTNGSNLCAAPETTECALDGVTSHDVWYTLDPADFGLAAADFTINVSATGTTPITTVNVAVFDDCPGSGGILIDPSNTTDGCNSIGMDLIYTCISSPITFFVGSANLEDGEFIVNVNAVDAAPSNDLCAGGATIVAMNGTESSDNICSDPDHNLCGGGDLNTDASTVYFQYTTNATDNVDLTITVTGGGSPISDASVVVFEDCVGTVYDDMDADLLDTENCAYGLGTNLDIECIPANTTLFIAVGSTLLGEGEFDISFTEVSATPPNDDCLLAEVLTANTATPGTNECSSIPVIGSACDVDKISTVWYTYTVGANDKEIIIDVTGWNTTGADLISVAAFDDCASLTFMNQADGSVADYCGASGTDLLVLSCPDPGTDILILVSSAEANEGTFDITVNANMPVCTYTNDVCETTAEDLGVLVTGDPCVTVSGCNDLACTETNTGGCPDYINTVFYTFTTDANADDAFINVEVLNGEGGELDAPGVMIFQGGCAALAQLGACFTGGGGTTNSGPVGGAGVILANTTYTVVVANTDDLQNGGDFDLCITITAGCVNDACNDAFEITGLTTGTGTTTTEPASTSNCTMDLDCGNNSISTAWYRFTLPLDAAGFDVDISGITSTASVQIGLYACPTPVVDVSDCNVTGTVRVPCAIPGAEYFVLVGTNDGVDESDFEITITPTPPINANDLCGGAENLVITNFCEFQDFSGTTRDACPEGFTADGCDYSVSPVSWYSFTTPDPLGATAIEITGALLNPQFGIFTQCDPLTFLGGFGCNTALTENIVLNPNTTYYIPVGSQTAGEAGPFTIRIKIDVPPVNDTPDATSSTPPLDLSGGGSHSGTTCCAIGFNDDNTQDFRNLECAGAFDDDAVWYTFTPDGASQGVEIIVNAGSIGAGSVEVYEGGPGANILGSSCAFPAEFRLGCAMNLGEIWIKVSSTEAGCGTFSVMAQDIAPSCQLIDECVDAVPLPLVTDLDGIIAYDCNRGCLDLACPDATGPGNCLTGMNPTAWYAFDVDADAAQLFVSVVSDDGSWSPSFTIYSGDCTALVDAGGCNTDDTTPDVMNVGVIGPATYYVAITATDPEDIVSPEFTICGAAIVATIACIGGVPPDYTPDCTPVATFTVMERSFDPGGALGLPLEGPFCPEEIVNVCSNFFYDATATGQDWLHGVIPIFGDGWDRAGFDPATISITPGGAVWYPEGSTTFTETMPNLCTYTDSDGFLQICNTFCQPCANCTNPLPTGSGVPGAWFWNTANAGAPCDGGTTQPDASYGIGTNTATVNFCVDIPVKMFATTAECEAASLEFGFQATSDGATGCWNDPLAECLQDVVQLTTYTIDCRVAPEVEATPNPAFICSGDALNIFVQTVNDPDGRDIVIVIDNPNPNISGYTTPITFTGGAGTITDILTITDPAITTPQVVIYQARSIVPDQVCPGPTLDIEITVYPDIQVTFAQDPVLICPGDCATLTPILVGGNGTYSGYSWLPDINIDDVTSPTPEVCPIVTTTYMVTVTDSQGCTGTGEVTVEVTDQVELMMVPDVIDICQVIDGDAEIYDVYVQVISGTPTFDYVWSGPGAISGGNGQPSTDFFGDTYHINEETSGISAGAPFELYVTVTDVNGCTNEALALVNINEAPYVDIQGPPAACGVTEVTITGTGSMSPGSSFIAETSIWSCDGIQLATNFDDEVTYLANLLDYDCFYVITEDANGCTNQSDDLTIAITSATDIVFVGDSILCDGEAGTIAVSNTADYASYIWAPNGEISPNINIENGVGTYTVTATAADGCESIDQFNVLFNPNPIVQISGSATFCQGTSTMLSGGGDPTKDSYDWEGPPPFTSVDQVITVSTAGQYILTLTDSLGCIGMDTIVLIQRDTLEPIISGGAMCDSSSVILTAIGFETYQWFNPDGTDTGETNDTLIVNVPGTYTVSVTNQGCSGSGTFEVLNNQPPVVEVADTVFVCSVQGEDQTLNFTTLVIGDLGVWTQVGLGGPDLADLTNVDFEGLGIGDYTFVYTDTVAIAPCTNQTDTMIVSLVRPSAATFAPDDLCNDNGMQILSELENTTNPGQWTLISGPAGNTVDITSGVFDASSQMSGDYLLEFTIDAIPGINCRPSSQQTLTVFDAQVIVPSGVDNTVCNAMTGGNVTTFDLATLLDPASDAGTFVQTGGNAIAIAGTVIDANGLTTGEMFTFTYTTTADPSSPCQPVMMDFTIEVRNCLCPEARLDPLPSICNDTTGIELENYLTTTRGGTWSSSATSAISGSIFNPANLASGPYTVYYVFTDQIAGCPDTLSEVLAVRAAPSITFNSFDAPCNMDVGQGPTIINLTTLVSGNGTSLGMWSQVANGSPTLVIEPDNSVDFRNQVDGTPFIFEYTTTTEGPNSPCMNTAEQITITVVDCNCDNPNIDPTMVCNDSGLFDLSVMLTSTTDPGTFTALDLSMSDLVVSGTQLDVTDLPAGDYAIIHTLTEIQDGICPQADTAFLSISALRSATLLAAQDVCTIDTGSNSFIVDLNSFITDGDLGGVFLDGSGVEVLTPASVSFLNEANGAVFNFEYVLPGDGVCDSVFYSFVVNTVDCDCPLIQPLQIPDVCTDQVTYDLTTFSDPDQPGTWSAGTSGLTITNDVISLTGVLAGSYTVEYIITNQEPDCDISRERVFDVYVPFNPGIAAEPLRVCIDESRVVALRDLLENEDDGGDWTESSVVGSTGTAFSALNGEFNTDGQIVGIYSFTYTFSGNEPCPPVFQTVEVQIDPLPLADAGMDGELTCDILQVTIGGSSSSGPNFTYSWLLEDDAGVQVEVGTDITLAAMEQGSYTIVVTDTESNCTSSDVVQVSQDEERPSIIIEDTPISCFGVFDASINIIASGGQPPYMYSIDGGVTSVSSSFFGSLAPGTYEINVEDAQGCSSPETVLIDNKDQVTVDVGDNIGIEVNTDSVLTLSTNIPLADLANIIWTKDGEVVCEGVENCQQYRFTADFESATFCATVVDVNDCRAEDCLAVVTKIVRNVSVPNIFSPDLENNNNFFYINSSSIEIINKMLIYDRWGELVFETRDVPAGIPNVGWDGRFNGNSVNPGVYVYVIEITYKDSNDEREILKGDITVMK